MASPQLYDERHLIPAIRVKIDGSDLPIDIVNDVMEIVVEQSVSMPDACTIRIHDWDHDKNEFRWVDDARLKDGGNVEVMMGYANELTTVFQGEITTFEMDAAAHMTPHLVIHALNKEHRLHRNRVRKTYQNCSDSDIVTQVAGSCGLSAEADSTTQVRDWICQNNQTDFEFIKMLADRNGYRFYVEGDKLHFKKVDTPTSADATVAWGDTLRSFRPRLTANGMVDQVTVHGWDPQAKQMIVGTKSAGDGKKTAQVGESKSGGAFAAAKFGSGKHSIVDCPVTTQEEADTIAQSYLDKRETSFVAGDGLCVGDTAIAAGKTVEVKGVGTRFSGKYFVTSATHTFTPAEGYTTQFRSSGKSPDTIIDILAGERQEQHSKRDFIAVGLVTDNKDPQNQGRVKVQYPWLMEDTSFWARIASPMAGADRGFYFLPEVGDEVLVAFEHGDIHYPYVVGALWNGRDAPVEPNDVAVTTGVVHRVIKTRAGHTIMLDDTAGEELIKVTTKAGHYVLLDDGKDKIEISDSAGTEKMTIMTNTGDVEWICNGNFKITSNQQVQISGVAGVQVSSDAQVQVSSQAGTSVTSTANVQIQGTMVEING